MIVASASKLATADLDNLMRVLEIDVVALRATIPERSHRGFTAMAIGDFFSR
jgi:hypothetical protein